MNQYSLADELRGMIETCDGMDEKACEAGLCPYRELCYLLNCSHLTADKKSVDYLAAFKEKEGFEKDKVLPKHFELTEDEVMIYHKSEVKHYFSLSEHEYLAGTRTIERGDL